MPGDAHSVKMDDRLRRLLLHHFDGSVATVCESILSGGRNQVERMASAFGTHLNTFFQFLKSVRPAAIHYEGFQDLYEIADKAMDIAYAEKGRPLDTPASAEELLNTPMHPDVKDIKSHYRSMIFKRFSK